MMVPASCSNGTPLIAFLLSLLFTVASAADTCSTVQSTHPGISILYSHIADYNVTVNDYWSTGCAALRPACVLLPKSANEVSSIVKILNENGEAFAVKSGGHSPNKYFASINGGPLISTKLLNEVVYNDSTKTVRVGPGNHWHNVSEALQKTGMNAVGGRMGAVGVGGYLLGGGLSFLSAERGWAASHILEADVVLADGSIVKASNSSNSDLLAAIKGGGGNYGIVTSFTLRAFPQGQVWGGVRAYASNKTPQMLEAIRDYTEHNMDPKAGIIATAEVTGLNLVDLWIIFFFYNGPKPPADVFAKFSAIGHILDTTQTRSYHDLVIFNNNFVLKGSKYTIATETMPLPNSTVGGEVMKGIYDTWHKVATSVPLVSGVVVSIAFQPMPKSIIRKTQEYGGIVLDLDDSTDRIILELDYSYWNDKDEDLIDRMTVKTYSGLREKIQGYIKEGKLPDAHLPLFMNDAYFRQDYWGRLKDSSKHKATQKRVDPNGFWQKRTKGFSL